MSRVAQRKLFHSRVASVFVTSLTQNVCTKEDEIRLGYSPNSYEVVESLNWFGMSKSGRDHSLDFVDGFIFNVSAKGTSTD